jgi:histidinol-phosphate aminotransferase
MSTQPAIGRAAYRDLVCYSVDQPPVAIDLRDNTNLWGVPPAAARAIAASAPSVSRYPRIYAAELRQALADYAGVDPMMVVTGCGSDDVLDAALRALADPGDRVALLAPTFVTATIFARVNALVPIAVPLSNDWDANIVALLATEARIIYLCSPNNPTGGVVPRSALEHLLKKATGIVIVDEAYSEFAGVSSHDLVGQSPRLLTVRTMSKAFGLAGLRVGFGIGDPRLITEVEKARGPYKVNAVAERAALAALREDRAWVQEHVREAVANRERLARALRRIGLTPLPSGANFLLVPTPDAVALSTRLVALGVGVRLFKGLATFGDAIRITVGPWPVMERFLECLERAVAGLEDPPSGEGQCA